ncbi:MAG: SET domain-containing protein-lysine N-methyltransferase [Rubricoccaceae bacterium]|nr:SET domain-containing protein-lysine N-methyltransferase [Rubricoccaceae bacterium]
MPPPLSPFANGTIRVVQDPTRGALLLTMRPLRAGQRVYTIKEFRVGPSPTVHSIQVGPGAHADGLGLVASLNHSCDPGLAVDTEAMVLVALRDHTAGEELTYFYPSTEWVMTNPFACHCGAPQCVGVVAGAKFLPAAVLGRYVVSPHVRDLLLAEVSAPLVVTEPAAV